MGKRLDAAAAKRLRKQQRQEANRLARCGPARGADGKLKWQGKAAQIGAASVSCISLDCLGALSADLGDQIFQLAFARVLAERHAVELRCPPWAGAGLFAEGAAGQQRERAQDGDRARPMASSPPAREPPELVTLLLADRVVLSDAKWREWAVTQEPMASVVRAEGQAAGTARRVQKEVPQVGQRSLSQPHDGSPLLIPSRSHAPGSTGGGGGGGGVEPGVCAAMWGFFQMHTRAYKPYRRRLLEMFAPSPAVGEAAKRVLALAAAGGGGGTAPVVVVHVDGSNEDGGDAAAVRSWLADWAQRAPAAAAAATVLVCTGRAGAACPAVLPQAMAASPSSQVLTVAAALEKAAGGTGPLQQAVGGTHGGGGGCSEQQLICAVELAVSGLAGAVVIQNSALSFAAAMLAPEAPPLPPVLPDGMPSRFWRIDPTAGAGAGAGDDSAGAAGAGAGASAAAAAAAPPPPPA
eukprot:SAG22_NODE_855_length_6843_cov_3.865658_1_plen_464_part_10